MQDQLGKMPLKLVSWMLLVVVLFQGYHGETASIPTSGQVVNKTMDGTPVASSTNEEETINCIIQVFKAIGSGKANVLSRKCQDTVADIRKNNPAMQDEAVSDVTLEDNSDLQSELQDIASQSQSISANDGVTDESSDVMTKIDPDDAEDQDEEETSEDAPEFDYFDTSPVDEPFITSRKKLDDEFLVIPIKYLKAQFKADDGADVDDAKSEIPKDVADEEPITTVKTENKEMKKSMEEAESRAGEWEGMRDRDDNKVEDTRWKKVQNNSLTQRKTDALYRIELDIEQLDDDLHQLKGKIGDN
ncbi:uncharacterized protein LOC143446146 [Clavelina lepadiformis]|uniref:uncharacterized protein LOC143446146 n=1 Tax=Clavelina lepadiformis TaxID=159417 RepID=UPI004043497D